MKIGVLGLGLIGGSIFKKLREINEYELIGVSSSVNAENVFRDLKELTSCDVVFVCTPMNVTLETLEKLNKILPAKTIVTDVCSLKGFLSDKKFQAVPNSVEYSYLTQWQELKIVVGSILFRNCSRMQNG